MAAASPIGLEEGEGEIGEKGGRGAANSLLTRATTEASLEKSILKRRNFERKCCDGVLIFGILVDPDQ